MSSDACATGVLVDLSVPKKSPRKLSTGEMGLSKSSSSNEIQAAKNETSSCATGILVDLTIPCDQVVSDDKSAEEHIESGSADRVRIPDLVNSFPDRRVNSDTSIIVNFPNDSFTNTELSPLTLNAHQMAEIFEQANTVAVRIQIANEELHKDSKDPVLQTSNGEDLFSPDFGILPNAIGFCPNYLPIASTSTPANGVAPDIVAHFQQSENLEKEAAPIGEPAVCKLAQPSVKISSNANKGGTLMNRRCLKIPVTGPVLSMSKVKKTDSLSSESQNSTVSSTASDSAVSGAGATSRPAVSNAIKYGRLRKSLDNPGLSVQRPSTIRPSTGVKSEHQDALVKQEMANLPHKKPVGKLEKKVTAMAATSKITRTSAQPNPPTRPKLPQQAANKTSTATGKTAYQSTKK